jgi:hypothetical protein
MDCVLDLDLDFFVRPIAYWPDQGRRSNHEYQHAKSDKVRDFLEQKCHLSTASKIQGQEVEEHQDAFWIWRRWLDEKKLSEPFTVIHVDAHADLGFGDGGWIYLLTEFLALSIEHRRSPRVGHSGLNSGNFLAFAVGNRWISDLRYVTPNCAPAKLVEHNFNIVLTMGGEPVDKLPVSKAQDEALAKRSGAEAKLPCRITERGNHPVDLLRVLFQGDHWRTGFIELKQYCPEDVCAAVDGLHPSPVSVEPAIPFDLISERDFQFSGFTHMILAQSPQYTPESADQLLPIIREYFTI